MKMAATGVGMMAIGGAWLFAPLGPPPAEDGVVLTRPAQSPREVAYFTQAFPAFGVPGEPAGPSEPPLSSAPRAAPSGSPERIMGEADLRRIISGDMARMKSIGIGMNVDDRQSGEDAS